MNLNENNLNINISLLDFCKFIKKEHIGKEDDIVYHYIENFLKIEEFIDIDNIKDLLENQ